ncbi:MAG: hypothetical protein HC817_07230 [Saprospiraceae bacterium]|nr:hypothetical protein [Saprospiraceae bacterium]
MGIVVQRVSVSLPIEDAQRFKKLSKREKELFSKILSSWLSGEKLDLLTTMEFMSSQAKRRGLTPEILEQILREENP